MDGLAALPAPFWTTSWLWQALRALPVDSSEHGKILRALPVDSSEHGKTLRALPVDSSEHGKTLRAPPVDSSEHGKALRALPVGSAAPGKALRALLVGSAALHPRHERCPPSGGRASWPRSRIPARLSRRPRLAIGRTASLDAHPRAGSFQDAIRSARRFSGRRSATIHGMARAPTPAPAAGLWAPCVSATHAGPGMTRRPADARSAWSAATSGLPVVRSFSP